MSSAYCAAMKRAYEQAKASVSALYGELSDCTTAVSNSIPCMQQIIINSQQIDNGKMSEFLTSLNTVKGNLDSIVAECDEMIAYWEQQYQLALAREREEAEGEEAGGEL